MNILHTPEECIYHSNRKELAHELAKLADKYSNSEIGDIAQSINNTVKDELAKYNHLIGSKVYGTIYYKDNKPFFTGTIIDITHFNLNTVRCKVRYNTIAGNKSTGFDGYSLKDLTIIE